MRHTLAILVPLGAAVLAQPVLGRSIRHVRSFTPPSFSLEGRPIGGGTAATETPPYLAGGRIAAVGTGALAIDSDSGHLLLTDADGKLLHSILIGKNAGLMAYDPAGKLAYVADRGGNRVTAVKVGTTLELAGSYRTPVEPYGIALSPDRKTVLVTTIADRTLVALEATTGKEQWRAPLGREPRGIAVSPDGTRALVAYLTTGTVDQVDLLESHRTEHVALATATRSSGRGGIAGEGAAFARGAFTALFLGNQQAIVPFQRETPVQQSGGSVENTGSYGGGFEPPLAHQLAFLGTGGTRTRQVTATIGPHQPRALAWDAARDALYVAGLGSDTVLQVKNASQLSITAGVSASLLAGQGRCGPDGLAVAPDGDLLVWCSFSRSVRRVDVVDDKGQLAGVARVASGPTLVASSLTTQQHEGMILFHSALHQVSQAGALACSSCHPDGRADGLSWRIDKHELQTPVLAGRVVGTHPYKWDGGDPDLKASLTGTMKRLGGSGISRTDTAALAAYLEALPPPPAPTRDAGAVARGQALFDSAEVGCRSCHDGPAYTDNTRHEFKAVTLTEADTPSLIGLAASAPYYHDGSAATLEALLRDRARVHGMADTAKLSDRQVADLITFLETL